MRRREFITHLGGAAVAWPLAARAQQAERARRIGILHPGSPTTSYGNSLRLFRQALVDLGHVEGQNVILEMRWAEGQASLLPKLAIELVESNVDVIVTVSAVATLAASKATATIPIVQIGGGSPVQSGVAGSLARPGGNVTGITNQSEDIAAKLLELLLILVPRSLRIGILFVPDTPAAAPQLRQINDAARTKRVSVHAVPVSEKLSSLDSAFEQFVREDVDGLVVLSAAILFSYSRKIVEHATKGRLPAVYPYREFIDDGGLMSYGVNREDIYRKGARLVDRVLKGTRPADLPIEQPTKFELVINLKTAKALGLTVPPELLARADEVIE